MAKVIRPRGEDVRRFMLENVEKYPAGITTFTAKHFGITRQAAHRHLRNLVEEKALNFTGTTSDRVYRLCPLLQWQKSFVIQPGLEEHVVWEQEIEPIVGKLPENVV